jgi:hypothetical protein
VLVFKCQQVVAEEGVYDTIFKHIGLTETGIEGLGLYKEVRFFHSQFQQCV